VILAAKGAYSMFGIASRLVQVQQATNPVQHVDEEQRKAGREAEGEFVKDLQTLGGVCDCDLFHALRVPDAFQTRRHEIDVVLLHGSGVYCIEVKNWSGTISVCDDPEYWQKGKTKSGSSSSLRQHPNPVKEAKKNAEILRNHLMRAGICLSANKFFAKVILTNKNCDLDDCIKNDGHVVTPDKVEEFAKSFARTWTNVITDPLIPYFFTGQLSYTQIDQTRSALRQIGTWDILELNGGKQLVGDYKGCAELSCNRQDVEELFFTHQRNATSATLWAIVGYAPTVNVTMYKRGGGGWFTRDTTGMVSLPYNRNIAFRIAGETADAQIPANDITRLLLSA